MHCGVWRLGSRQGGHGHGKCEWTQWKWKWTQWKWKRKRQRQQKADTFFYAARPVGDGISATAHDGPGIRRTDGRVPLSYFDFVSHLRVGNEDPCTTGARRPGGIQRTECVPARS